MYSICNILRIPYKYLKSNRGVIKFGKQHFLQMNSWKFRLTKTGKQSVTDGREREGGREYGGGGEKKSVTEV